MKQEMISYLSTCYDELRALNKKLYDKKIIYIKKEKRREKE